MSTRPTTAGVILDLLARAGVQVGFGIPGVHNLGFWNALAPGRPQIMNVRHEQTCVYAADGLARATGSLAVAFTTTGPGAANTIGEGVLRKVVREALSKNRSVASVSDEHADRGGAGITIVVLK